MQLDLLFLLQREKIIKILTYSKMHKITKPASFVLRDYNKINLNGQLWYIFKKKNWSWLNFIYTCIKPLYLWIIFFQIVIFALFNPNYYKILWLNGINYCKEIVAVYYFDMRNVWTLIYTYVFHIICFNHRENFTWYGINANST